MNGRSYSAPGKVMLSGEYAVLFDAPAIVAAVDRRARANVRPSAATDCGRVTMTGYVAGCWRYRQTRTGAVRWLDEPPAPRAFALVEHVLEVAAPARPLQLELDTAAFTAADGSTKLGLGSSAALAVALAAALGASGDALGRQAHEAHRRFQGGEGSGADVACALAGGILAYRRRAPLQAEQLAWPRGLYAGILWSGRAASTTGGIGRLRRSLDDAGPGAPLDRLGTAAAGIAASWQSGDVTDLLARLAGYVDVLRAFSDRHDLDIFASGHAALCELAASCGIVYKPCGAGGGDVGAAFTDDAAALETFRERAAAGGFTSLPVTLGAHGVRQADGTDH
ncbi:MAG: hypothetical protein U5K76_09630 [Woeseiaceae bacterium]|nr:hypothetical protein [Woeseiaceae bacterium]